jgi:hypothetical protein
VTQGTLFLAGRDARALFQLLAEFQQRPEYVAASSIDVVLISDNCDVDGSSNQADGLSLKAWCKYDSESESWVVLCFSRHHEATSTSTRLSDTFRKTVLAGHSVLVATDEWGLGAASFVGLQVYLGSEPSLQKKYANTVPLTGHGATGLANVVKKLIDHADKRPLRYADLALMPQKALEFFQRPAAAKVLYEHALSASAKLMRRFQSIRCVFGLGFPYYLARDDKIDNFALTPPSIINYLRSQGRYFSEKIISNSTYLKHEQEWFNRHELRRLGVRPGRSVFDKEWFRLHGTEPVESPQEATLSTYYAENCFDLSNAIWPCQYCTYLNNEMLLGKLEVQRGFNEECLGCNQTSLTERNVMACVADLDLLVVTEEDPEGMASAISGYIQDDPALYLHDCNANRAVIDYEPPVDAFVVSEDAVRRFFYEVAQNPERDNRVAAIATWLPNKAVTLRLGFHFALGFQLLRGDADYTRLLEKARKQYASKVSVDLIVQLLRRDSLYHRQLLRNASVVRLMHDRVKRWNAYPDDKLGRR